jgi:2'-5' RNA ligase
MPYEIQQSAKGYCVHKQGDSGPALGCHKSKSKALRQVKALYASESETMKEHTGVMVALPVPERYHEMIAGLQSGLPRGTEHVPAEELHVTLLYLGDSSEIERLKRQVYVGALNSLEWQNDIPAKLTGLARFNGSEEGRNPLVLLVDSPMLPSFRQRLFSHLTERGIPDNQRHGFIPHITLGYIPIDAKTPQLEVPQEQIVFDSFAVAWGDETLIVPLSGDAAYKAEGKGYGARAGETIRGNLIRGGDGKFGSAGDSTSAAPADEKKPTIRNQRLGRTAAARETAKLQAREAKKRTTAAESEKKRQARRAETEKRREQNKRVREAKRAADKKQKLDESERKLQENRQKTLEKTPLNQEAYDSLLAFSEARDGEFDPRMIEAIAKETGLIAIGNDGTFRMSPEAKAFLKALDKGDARAARDAISRAGDKLDRLESSEEKKAFTLKHGSHNQATHANRYGSGRGGGAGALKEHFRRLSKDERERFKAEARRRGEGTSWNSPQTVRVDGTNVIVPARYHMAVIGPVQMGKPTTSQGRKEISVSRNTVDREGRVSSINVVISQQTKGGATYDVRLRDSRGQQIARNMTLQEARRASEIFLTHTTGANHYSAEKSGYRFDRQAIRQAAAGAGIGGNK